MSSPPTRHPGGSLTDAMRWLGLVGIAAIAIIRCLILFAPQVVFDTDPALKDSTPLAGLGPPGSLLLDVILLGSCAIALLGEWRTRERGIDWLILLLALIPMPVVLWHGAHDAGNLWRGTTWAAAAVACATISHLGCDPLMRRVLLALLVAAVVPLLMRGVSQLTYEHSDMVAFYEKNREQILHSKGWEVDSSSARLYEHRLRQPQPLGWFTTTNIFATFAAFGLIMWLGLSMAAIHARMQSGWPAAMALCALACAVALAFTGSKGAILAAALGIGIWLILEIGSRRIPERIVRLAPLILLGSIAATIGAVIARGALLPEGFAGEKSLLFRWQYLGASARMFLDRFWTGVGPDGYQQAYTLYRSPRATEEVASAHSMFVDWLSTLGVSGFAWIGLIVVLILRSRELLRSNAEASTMVKAGANLKAILWAAVPAVLAAVVIERSALMPWPIVDWLGIIVRCIGGIGLVVVAALSLSVMRHSEDRWIGTAIIAAVAALLIHGQIEMTFQQPGSVVWALCAVGLLGPARSGRSARAIGAVLIALIAIATCWITIKGVVPAWRQENAMIAAADIVKPLGIGAPDIVEVTKRRRQAASALVAAYEMWPANVAPLEAAAVQLTLAGSPDGPQPLGLYMAAREIAERAIQEHGRLSSMALAIGIDLRIASITNDSGDWSDAIGLARRMTELDPQAVASWKRLGDIYWSSGKRADAADAYKRTLERDKNFELDELKRLSDSQRREVQSRIEQANL